MITLTLVCRQPLVASYADCEHAQHTDKCCGEKRIDGKLPEGHEHGVDCCEHSCEAENCPDGIDYRPAFHGAHKQCGETATFVADTPTAAEDQAVAAGWRVDLATKGEYARADVCPECNGDGFGRRTIPLRQGSEAVENDSYAAA